MNSLSIFNQYRFLCYPFGSKSGFLFMLASHFDLYSMACGTPFTVFDLTTPSSSVITVSTPFSTILKFQNQRFKLRTFYSSRLIYWLSYLVVTNFRPLTIFVERDVDLTTPVLGPSEPEENEEKEVKAPPPEFIPKPSLNADGKPKKACIIEWGSLWPLTRLFDERCCWRWRLEPLLEPRNAGWSLYMSLSSINSVVEFNFISLSNISMKRWDYQRDRRCFWCRRTLRRYRAGCGSGSRSLRSQRTDRTDARSDCGVRATSRPLRASSPPCRTCHRSRVCSLGKIIMFQIIKKDYFNRFWNSIRLY